MREITQEELKEILHKHKLWLEGDSSGVKANLSDANLRVADLSEADLSWADLREADLDYSCWPLWCGSLGAKVDQRIAAQIAYHFCRLDCDDAEYLKARNALVDFANKFHRVEECGVIERK